MFDEARVKSLLDELLESNATPETVCRDCPELLPEVRNRWHRLRQLRIDLDDLLPVKGNDQGLTSSDPADLPQIPGYQVEALLGHGGMGVVFRAVHLALKRHVAIKMTLAGAYSSASEMARFQREAEAVARLRHPNVVQIYDTGQWKGRSFFTMELVEGESLAQRINGHAQPARASAELVAALAGAICAAHDRGVVHRDLKPGNILLTHDGTPKITDFGLAMRLEGDAHLTRTGAALGTWGYMAPEQARGAAEVGPPADVHGLGAILYELLTGQPPYRGDSPAEIMEHLLTRDPVVPSTLNPSIPRDLEIICLHCLHKEPNRRYPTAAALRQDLQRFVQGEAIAARPEGQWEWVVRHIRRSPWQFGSLAAAITSLIVLAMSGWWFAAERGAVARRNEAEREAVELAVAEDLQSMKRFMNWSLWPEAQAALERARGRLGKLSAESLQSGIHRGQLDLTLVTRLDDILLNGHEREGGNLRLKQSAVQYETEFRDHGYGDFTEEPAVVADRIRESSIARELIAALDHWFNSTEVHSEKEWIFEVALLADPHGAGWRNKAREVLVHDNKVALLDLLSTVPVADLPASLLLSLENQVKDANEERLAFLKRVQLAHPKDLWVNLRLAVVCHQLLKPREAVGYYQAAGAIRPRTPFVLNNLGIALAGSGREAEAAECYREAIKYDPTLDVAHRNLVTSLWASKRYDEADRQLDASLSANPRSAILFTTKGMAHEARGGNEEALKAYRRAVELDPQEKSSLKSLRSFLTKHGGHDEARRTWHNLIACSPMAHDACYGYAEYCLFLNCENEYSLARTELLKNYGSTTNAHIAERTSRACLLGPLEGEELQQAVELADFATKVGAERKLPAHAHFLFTQALARYRQGNYPESIAILNGPAAKVLGPAPNLVLAMALYRQGNAEVARETFKKAIASYNWDPRNAVDHEAWIFHALRREAERIVIEQP